jgi:spore coat protein A, manganese oxidase
MVKDDKSGDKKKDKGKENDKETQRGRRDFLKITGTAVGGSLALGPIIFTKSKAPRQQTQLTSKQHLRPRNPRAQLTAAATLARFVDPLPRLSVISPTGTLNNVPFFDVNMLQFTQKLHRDLPATKLWGYNGKYPGPTFETRRGRPIAVRWRNSLPTTHFLPIDFTIHGAEAPTPQVRTVVHLHGAKVLPNSDGYPEAWFTNGFAQRGPFFQNQVYNYPNDQQATSLWYHDHALGITRLNLYTGLEGFYFIRDNNEDDLNLPSGPFEIPLMIQDRLFNPDGSLQYPVQTPGDPDIPPVWVPEFFGDTVLVNGKVWPFLEVEARKYRFRVLNASNARFYHLTLNESDSQGNPNGRRGPSFFQIGTDGGLLPAPVRLNDLTIAPAERFDIVIDFSGADGKFFVLNNDAKAPFPDGDDVIPSDVMLFKVVRARNRDNSSLPSTLGSVPLLSTSQSSRTRDLVLIENASAQDNPIEGLINVHWEEPVTESPRAGSIETWRIINTTGDAHPIHIHLVEFQILDRQPFDTTQFPDRLVFTGPRVTPPRNERPAFKDTVQSFPGEVTRVIQRFTLPSGTRVSQGQRFRYVFHCHILEHEDNDMMRPYDVVG